jgi:hypothetical protein
MDSRKLVAIALFTFAAMGAHAQTAGVVTLRANQTSATGSLTPVLTWSTNPVAQSCRASGGWSGNKAASGTQTLPRINASTNFTLTCSWNGGTALVRWTAPTQNSNGSTLTNLGSFRVVYGTAANALNQSFAVSDVTARQATIQSLTPGTWYFAVRARTTTNLESSDSNVASKAVTGATAARTVAIAITPTTTPPPTTPPPTTPPPPPPPTTPTPGLINPTPPPPNDGRRLFVNVTEATELVRSGTWYVLGRGVGTIPLNTPCDPTFRAGGRYLIPRNLVTLTKTPVSQQLVAQCAWR